MTIKAVYPADNVIYKYILSKSEMTRPAAVIEIQVKVKHYFNFEFNLNSISIFNLLFSFRNDYKDKANAEEILMSVLLFYLHVLHVLFSRSKRAPSHWSRDGICSGNISELCYCIKTKKSGHGHGLDLLLGIIPLCPVKRQPFILYLDNSRRKYLHFIISSIWISFEGVYSFISHVYFAMSDYKYRT